MVVYNQWTGILEWTTGLIFHILGGLVDSHWLQVPLTNLQPILKWSK